MMPQEKYESSLISSFWNVETSGQTASYGGTGKTTAEMHMAKTFLDAGWDFLGETANGTEDIWKIAEGLAYPRLAWEKYSGGTGEPNDPYQIATAADLIALGETPEDYDKHFILTADIDLDPNLPGRKVFDRAVIAPDTNDVGSWFEGTAFAGVFDGDGHVISRLTINGGHYVNLGLFGQLAPGGEVKGLGVVDVNITGGIRGAGALCASNLGSIRTSYSTGSVSGSSNGLRSSFGGLVAGNFGTIAQCYSHASVSSDLSVGGLVGINLGNLVDSYSTGLVRGPGSGGGLVGTDTPFVPVLNMGPPVGTASGCFWDIETSGRTTSDGGEGKTTAEMQTASTFLDAGWDFVGETVNGPNDVWKIAEGLDYPRLWWEPYDGRVTVVLGQVFTVTLESNPSTGYRWEWVDHQDSIVEQMGEAQFKPRATGDPPLVGAGGWESFDFQAVHPGQMTLKLVYRRPWEEGVEPLKSFSLQVTVP